MLVDCPDCGRAGISSRAPACPSCGAPIAKKRVETVHVEPRTKSGGIGCGTVVLVIVGFMVLWPMFRDREHGDGPSSSHEREELKEPRRRPPKEKGTIAVTVLGTRQASRSHSEVTIRATNETSNYIKHVVVRAEALSSSGRFLGAAEIMLSSLGPGASQSREGLIPNMQSTSVDSYRMALAGVVGEDGLRHDREYRIRVD